MAQELNFLRERPARLGAMPPASLPSSHWCYGDGILRGEFQRGRSSTVNRWTGFEGPDPRVASGRRWKILGKISGHGSLAWSSFPRPAGSRG
jgi:hypothetical protein